MRIVLFFLFFSAITNLHAQNIGIGEASPAARLHVKGSGIGYATATLLLQNSAGDALINVRDNGYAGIGVLNPMARLHVRNDFETMRIEGNSSFISFYDGSTYKGYLWQKAGNAIELGTAAGSNMPVTIAPNNAQDVTFLQGYTGIGVSNPTSRLEVNGRVRLRNISATETAGIWFNNFSNSDVAAFVGMATDHSFGFYGGSSGWSLLVDSWSGDVSIGSIPEYGKLTVRSGIFRPAIDIGTGPGEMGIALRITGGGIQVHGADINTPTTVFVHKATASNTVGMAYTVIDNPFCNYNPAAILQVTLNGTYGTGVAPGYEVIPEVIVGGAPCSVTTPTSFMIFFNGSNSGFYATAPAYARDKWCIRAYVGCEVTTALNFNFNVMVIRPN